SIQLPKGTAVPDGAIKLPDGNIKLPEGTATLPPGTVKLPFDGPAKYLDGDGNYYKADGSLHQHIDEAPVEKTPDTAPAPKPDATPAPKPDADAPLHATPARVEAPDRVLTSVGGRADDGIHLTSDLSHPLHTVDNGVHGTGAFDNTPTGRAGDHGTPGGHAPENMPRNDLDNTPRSGSRPDTPTTAGTHTADRGPGAAHTDGPGSTGGHGGGPGGTGHPDGPSTGGSHPETPGAGGLDDGGRTADDAAQASDEATAPGDSPEAGSKDGGAKAGTENPYAGQEPDYSRPALLPADGPLTLRDVRNTRDHELRWQRGEEFHRQMWGGGAERAYPVPMNADPRYPVTTPGGRKVDVPVDLPDGRVIAVEVKTYGPYRTITLKDETTRTIVNEVPLKPAIKEQINKDIALRRLNPGYDPRWSFTHAGPSAELRKYLTDAKIIFLEYGPHPKRDQWDPPTRRKK
ncbi:hypothetical protein AB0D44_12680, partial [Streptomyces sp. NPDC048349]